MTLTNDKIRELVHSKLESEQQLLPQTQVHPKNSDDKVLKKYLFFQDKCRRKGVTVTIHVVIYYRGVSDQSKSMTKNKKQKDDSTNEWMILEWKSNEEKECLFP